MDDKEKALATNNVLTKNQLMEYFSNISLPDGVVSTYYENDNYIEFTYENSTYAILVSEENLDEIKNKILEYKEKKQYEDKQIKESEKRDALTKLYNKEYSKHMIEDYLAKSDLESHHALMIVDINNFNFINENLGYLFGDTVLVNVAESMNKIFDDSDILSRIGQDEFLVFMKHVDDLNILKTRAEDIYSVIQDTYTGDHQDYSMSCNIGIAIYADDAKDFNTLFMKADAALNYTRQNEQEHYSFYGQIENNQSYCREDCFDEYITTKTSAYGSSNFDKEITAFAFDIMSRTKDVNSAINLLLDKVRKQFDCDHICIIETSLTPPEYQITYLRSKYGKDSDNTLYKNQMIRISDLEQKLNQTGIYFINDVKKDLVPTYDNVIGFQAVLQCGIYEDGIFKGCVSIDDFEKPRYWTQYEIDSLVTITKVISSYLLKMRASERANQELYRIRNYDSLTGLPTLSMFKKNVKKLLEENPDKNYAIIYSDISQFKHINDSLGYAEGDKVLCSFAQCLIQFFMQNKGLSRSSDDNFLAVIQYDNDEEQLMKHIIVVNEQFNIMMKSQYPANKFIINSGISVINPLEGITAAIDNANIARKSVKNPLKTVCKFFDHSMKEKLQRENEITNNMEQALKEGEFIVYLQPKIGLSNNQLVGAEALVRWKKKDGTMILPNDFIPIFEKNGFIINLDFFVYEEVCKMIYGWLSRGLKVVPISINVSRLHLNDENFIRDIKRLVDKYNIPYHLIELEITESIFLNNTEVAISTMRSLRNLGFVVSMDDFGAGYSSLNLLKEMTTDVIKLDKEFFGKGEMQKEEQIILSSIISMAKQLNMKVLSEGVETQKQSDFLKSVYCDMAQGFLFSRPICHQEFEKMLIKANDPTDSDVLNFQ